MAIKVLSADFTSDAERVARFEREARKLASLNDPNIGAIYDFHEETLTRKRGIPTACGAAPSRA